MNIYLYCRKYSAHTHTSWLSFLLFQHLYNSFTVSKASLTLFLSTEEKNFYFSFIAFLLCCNDVNFPPTTNPFIEVLQGITKVQCCSVIKE